jgi:hypothetical protein
MAQHISTPIIEQQTISLRNSSWILNTGRTMWQDCPTEFKGSTNIKVKLFGYSTWRLSVNYFMNVPKKCLSPQIAINLFIHGLTTNGKRNCNLTQCLFRFVSWFLTMQTWLHMLYRIKGKVVCNKWHRRIRKKKLLACFKAVIQKDWEE